MDYETIQRALQQKGYSNLGHSGANEDGVDGDWGPRSIFELQRFQKDNGLLASGIPDAKTLVVLGLVPPSASGTKLCVPASWMPSSKMKGIVVHWTAGTHKASSLDKKHYHILIESDGDLIRGIPTIRDNSLAGLTKNYAAHTLNCNSGYIGVSLCCMGDNQTPSRVKEKPFFAGAYPMTKAQWDRLPYIIADLARRYGIPINKYTVLSHAEVEPTLGIKQKGKWDITRLAFDSSFIGHKACGDAFRSRALQVLNAG